MTAEGHLEMIADEIASKPPIARDRRAIVRITPELIGELLGLPETVAIAGARIDYMFGNMPPYIELLICGEPLPRVVEGAPVLNETMIFRVVEEAGFRTIYGSFRGLPENEWVVSKQPRNPL